jgi:hypothetical protein
MSCNNARRPSIAGDMVLGIADCSVRGRVLCAWVAYSNLKTYKLFELIKSVEAPHVRQARHIVFHEIRPRKHEKWWEDQKDGQRWEEAASTVCASYDVVATIGEYEKRLWMLPRHYQFFARHYARSIIWAHDALENYLNHRREAGPDAYRAFTRLADAARQDGIVR